MPRADDRARGRPSGRLSVADLLQDWSEGLCFVTDLTPAAIAHAIGVVDSLVPELEPARIEPPPPGMRWVRVVGGPVAHLDVGLDRHVVDRGALDSRFGEGRPVPRVDYDRPHTLVYDVSVVGAPARCSVFGRFDEEPKSEDVDASAVTLRIDPR